MLKVSIVFAAAMMFCHRAVAQEPAAASPPEVSPTAAPAQEPPAVEAAPMSDELPRLRLALEDVAEGERSHRLWGGVLGLGLGAALIPAGLVVMGREAGNTKVAETEGYILLGVGIGAAIGGVLNFFIERPVSQLLSTLDEQQRAGVAHDKIVAAVLAEWREAAESARLWRTIGGWVSLVGGVVIAGIGAGFAFMEPQEDFPHQYTHAAVLGVGGAICALFGLQELLVRREPVEHGYRAFSAARSSAPSLGLAPLPGGAAVSLSAQF